MSKLVDIETIRKEIMRRKEENNEDAITFDDSYNEAQYSGYDSALNDISSFLDTLPEENSVNLEKELISWWEKHYSRKDYEFEKMNGHYIENTTLLEIAEHFFNLGRMAKKD